MLFGVCTPTFFWLYISSLFYLAANPSSVPFPPHDRCSPAVPFKVTTLSDRCLGLSGSMCSQNKAYRGSSLHGLNNGMFCANEVGWPGLGGQVCRAALQPWRSQRRTARRTRHRLSPKWKTREKQKEIRLCALKKPQPLWAVKGAPDRKIYFFRTCRDENLALELLTLLGKWIFEGKHSTRKCMDASSVLPVIMASLWTVCSLPKKVLACILYHSPASWGLYQPRSTYLQIAGMLPGTILGYISPGPFGMWWGWCVTRGTLQ